MLSTFSSTISFNLYIFTNEETGESEYLSNFRPPHCIRQVWDLTPILLSSPGLFSHQRAMNQAYYRALATRKAR